MKNENQGFVPELQNDDLIGPELIDLNDSFLISRDMDKARSVLQKPYSLEPDMVQGWIPKIPSMPMPLYYSQNLQKIKLLVQSDTKYKITYEWKNTKYNTVKLHKFQSYKWQKRQKYQMKLKFLQEAVQKIGKPKNFQLKSGRMDYQNQGQFRFNSDFQSGNLQLAIQVKSDQFDCYLRSDSNTNGHTNWYFFSVQNFQKLGSIRINICNLIKVKNFYGKGMQPYVKTAENQEWSQNKCEEVNFCERYCRYRQNKKNSCLQFKYNFSKKNQKVYFSYCIPFTYSDCLNFIEKISENKNLQILTLGESFSSLTIPMIRVTNFKIPSLNKKTVVMIGRTHPGQSNSSYVIQGLIKQLISQSNLCRYLRDKFQFYIIPMLNVDGVVIGNFRCGGQGLDFNRYFSLDSKQPIQVRHVIEFVNNLKEKNQRIQYFFDFHGHSQQKNCFFYGPQFDCWQKYFMKSRLFTKLFEQKSQTFKYNLSCFQISQYKINTARSYMSTVQKIPMTFTLQVSNGVYELNKQQKRYCRKQFQLIGKQLLSTIIEFQKLEDTVQNKLKFYQVKQANLASIYSSNQLKLRKSMNNFNTFYERNNNQRSKFARNLLKRSTLNIQKSKWENQNIKENKKRSSQNLQQKGSLIMNQLMGSKIKSIIQEIQKNQYKAKKSYQYDSDAEPQEDDLTNLQRKSFDSEINRWNSVFNLKNNYLQESKQKRKQKNSPVLTPKINNIFSNFTQENILKQKSQSSQRKYYFGNKYGKQSKTSEKQNLYKRSSATVHSKKSINNLNKSLVLVQKNSSSYISTKIIKKSSSAMIKNALQLCLQKQSRQVVRNDLFESQNKVGKTAANSPKKQFLISSSVNGVCDMDKNRSQSKRKTIKNSLWSNSNMKNSNILRSNRFPFVMQKFI